MDGLHFLSIFPMGAVVEEELEAIYFPYGLFGFEESRYLCFRKEIRIDHYFYLEECGGTLRFIVSDPFYFFPEYAPHISQRDLELLGVEEESILLLIAIVNGKKAPPCFNLSAPLLIDWSQKRGKQILV